VSDTFQRRVLEKMRIGLSVRVSPQVAQSLEIEPTEMDQFTNDLTLRISTFVLGEKLGKTEEVARLQVPATWWQHWKFSHAPEWFKKRFPVRYQWVLVNYEREERMTYPHAKVLPTSEWGLSVMSWSTHVDYDINATPFELDVVAREPEPEFLRKHELVSFLHRTRPMGDDFNYGTTLRILDGLKELGVNPDQLVTRQNAKF
jgi:hypothetical protein